jgi:hypothetical protein
MKDLKTAKIAAAVMAIIQEPTLKAAAEKAGISETTLWRWQQNPEFAKMLSDAKSTLLEAGIAKLQKNLTGAIDTLVEVMKDKAAAEASRVSAARFIVEATIGETKLSKIAERLDELEKSYTRGRNAI